MLKRSGASVSASSAVSTWACASPSSARIRRCSISARLGLELEGGARVHDPVIVLDLVGELQVAPLRFRLLGERDLRRQVRYGVELPGEVARAHTTHGGAAGFVDGETALLGALRG